MVKYIVALIVLAAGVALFFNAGDNEVKAGQKTVRSAEPVEHKETLAQSQQNEEVKPVASISKEKLETSKTVPQVEETTSSSKEDKPAAKPKRKLVGGAEVDFIENLYPEEKPTKFGLPPM